VCVQYVSRGHAVSTTEVERIFDLSYYILYTNLKTLNTLNSVFKDTILEGNPLLNLLQLNRDKGLNPTEPRQTKIFYRESANFSH